MGVGIGKVGDDVVVGDLLERKEERAEIGLRAEDVECVDEGVAALDLAIHDGVVRDFGGNVADEAAVGKAPNLSGVAEVVEYGARRAVDAIDFGVQEAGDECGKGGAVGGDEIFGVIAEAHGDGLEVFGLLGEEFGDAGDGVDGRVDGAGGETQEARANLWQEAPPSLGAFGRPGDAGGDAGEGDGQFAVAGGEACDRAGAEEFFEQAGNVDVKERGHAVSRAAKKGAQAPRKLEPSRDFQDGERGIVVP